MDHPTARKWHAYYKSQVLFFFPKVLECSFVHVKFLRGIFIMCVCVLVAQECPTLCDLMECSPPGSSVHWILQARILEWVAIPFFRGSS